MPDAQTVNSILQSYGVAGLSGGSGGINWGYWVAVTIFNSIGFIAMMYGWKQKMIRPTILGIVLMVYPFFISNVILNYVVGIALTVALFYWRD